MFKLLPSLLIVVGVFAHSIVFAQDRDPTKPLLGMATATETVRNLVLESILISGSRKIAVINGQTAMQNQTVDGALIQTITAQTVTVKYQGQMKKLHLMSPSIKSRDGIRQGY